MLSDVEMRSFRKERDALCGQLGRLLSNETSWPETLFDWYKLNRKSMPKGRLRTFLYRDEFLTELRAIALLECLFDVYANAAPEPLRAGIAADHRKIANNFKMGVVYR
jgi:hypothetical protein